MKQERERLPAGVRQGYGVAAFSIALANTSVLFFLLKFLIDGAGIEPATAGLVILVGKSWDAIIDPAIGRLSDRTRSPMGRRRPWIAWGALPFALLFACLWVPLDIGPRLFAALYALLLMFYSTAYSCVTVAYGALTPALSPDYDERTRLNTARMGWSMVGGIAAGVVVPLVSRHLGWPTAGALLAIAMLPPLWIAVRATRGLDTQAAGETEPPFSIRSSFSLLRVRPFRRTAILFVAAWTSIAVLSSLVPFYMQHCIGDATMVDPVLAVLQISGLLFVPLVGLLAGRVEKHRAYALGIGSWAFVLVGLAAVPFGGARTCLALAALAGPGVAAAHVLPWSMLPDVVESDQLHSGSSRAGAFYGTLTLLEQAATALSMQLVGIGLSASGYLEGAAEQPDSARLAIRALMGPAPFLVLGAAAIFAWLRPPLTRAEHTSVRSQLAARLASSPAFGHAPMRATAPHPSPAP